MNLKDYMKKKKRSAASIAKEAGVSPRTVTYLLEEGRDIKGSTFKKISLATDGAVTVDELIEEANKIRNSLKDSY